MNNEKVRVNARGQLVIPSRIRRKYGITKGTQVAFLEEDNRIVLQPITMEFIRSLRGSLKGKPSALESLLKDRRG
jgi:AbrB family looped-hinge helix DNA binding protein